MRGQQRNQNIYTAHVHHGIPAVAGPAAEVAERSWLLSQQQVTLRISFILGSDRPTMANARRKPDFLTYSFHLFFLLCLCGTTEAFNNTNGIELSCFLSYIPDDLSFCFMIDWRTARAYDKAVYNVYEPSNELQDIEQDRYARYLYDSYEPSGETPECRNALRRTICAEVFPECIEEGSSTSGVAYYETCKAQCDQLSSCSFSYKNECAGFPTDNCFILVAPGYFVLDPQNGPYEALPSIYGGVLAVWFLMAAVWHYITFYMFRDAGALVCRAIAGIPLIKIAAVVLGVAFWATCETWGMCSFWLSVAYVNTNLIFDTCLIGAFMILAKGWSITRQVVPPHEWRSVLILMSVFYLANSINLVLETAVYTTQGYWIANIVVYGLVYSYICHSVYIQLKSLREQVAPFKTGNLPLEIVGPLKMKYRMYVMYLLLVLAFISIEILTHSLLFTDNSVAIGLCYFEFAQIILILIMGFFFRPREFSPFFFMVATTMNDERARPTPIVEVDLNRSFEDATEDESEVDVTPLLQHSRISAPPAKMVFLKQMDGSVNLGVYRNASRLPSHKHFTNRQASNNRQVGAEVAFVDLGLGGGSPSRRGSGEAAPVVPSRPQNEWNHDDRWVRRPNDNGSIIDQRRESEALEMRELETSNNNRHYG